MMFFFLLLLFISMFFLGTAISLISVAKYSTYAETEGDVVNYLKCNPIEGEQLQNESKVQESAVVISYKVRDKTYHLATNIRTQENANGSSRLKILYDPYFPGHSCIKEETPLLGNALTGVSLICLTLLIFFF